MARRPSSELDQRTRVAALTAVTVGQPLRTAVTRSRAGDPGPFVIRYVEPVALAMGLPCRSHWNRSR